jgi:hypothetical protein
LIEELPDEPLLLARGGLRARHVVGLRIVRVVLTI